ncbi:PREDICTED: cytochrome c oxidase protein 20 homolog [Nipponia nippon]|uniref:cytochrome c oxidase protein 20 homolog n=1 Tax=Nipponia nippon TaxID=128390 RepID=UPI0005109248|nr:PREDICTED: cytochrome c oxidase protein 20 homolog [Nipponia nippon]
MIILIDEFEVPSQEVNKCKKETIKYGSVCIAPKREDESFKLLGFLDVKSVPCARESVLYGSLGSLVVGLGHFVATSRVRRSCDFAVGGFICTMLGYWFYCRYNLAQHRIRQRMLKEGMRNKILFEGSSLDPERKQTGNERSDS